jgi:hypothetical protein
LFCAKIPLNSIKNSIKILEKKSTKKSTRKSTKKSTKNQQKKQKNHEKGLEKSKGIVEFSFVKILFHDNFTFWGVFMTPKL